MWCILTTVCDVVCERPLIRVPTGQGKLEKVREFEWSGKVREDAKVTGKSRKFWGKFYLFCTVVVMLIVVELESNPPYC